MARIGPDEFGSDDTSGSDTTETEQEDRENTQSTETETQQPAQDTDTTSSDTTTDTGTSDFADRLTDSPLDTIGSAVTEGVDRARELAADQREQQTESETGDTGSSGTTDTESDTTAADSSEPTQPIDQQQSDSGGPVDRLQDAFEEGVDRAQDVAEDVQETVREEDIDSISDVAGEATERATGTEPTQPVDQQQPTESGQQDPPNRFEGEDFADVVPVSEDTESLGVAGLTAGQIATKYDIYDNPREVLFSAGPPKPGVNVVKTDMNVPVGGYRFDPSDRSTVRQWRESADERQANQQRVERRDTAQQQLRSGDFESRAGLRETVVTAIDTANPDVDITEEDIQLEETEAGIQPTLTQEGMQKFRTLSREQQRLIAAQEVEQQVDGVDVEAEDIALFGAEGGGLQPTLTQDIEAEIQQVQRRQIATELDQQIPGLDVGADDVTLEDGQARLTDDVQNQIAQRQDAALDLAGGFAEASSQQVADALETIGSNIDALVGDGDATQPVDEQTDGQPPAPDISPIVGNGDQLQQPGAQITPDMSRAEQREVIAQQQASRLERMYNVDISEDNINVEFQEPTDPATDPTVTTEPDETAGRFLITLSDTATERIEDAREFDGPRAEQPIQATQAVTATGVGFEQATSGGGGLPSYLQAIQSDLSGAGGQIRTDPLGAIFGPSGEVEQALGETASIATAPFEQGAQGLREDVVQPVGDVTSDVLTAGGVGLQLATPYTPSPEQDQLESGLDVLRTEEQDVTEEGLIATDVSDVVEGVAELGPMVVEGPETVRSLGALSSEGAAFTQRQIAQQGLVSGAQTTADVGSEVGGEVATQVFEQAQERPGFIAGTLLGTAGGIGLAARASGTAGRATAFAVQPGEEIASAGLTRAFPGVASRIPGGRIDVEEIALGGAVAGGRGIRRAASRVRNLDRGDLPTVEAPFRVEPTFEEGTGFYPGIELESETAESALLRRGVEGARSRLAGARERFSDLGRPQLTQTELDATGGELTARRRLNIDRPDFETPQRIQSAIDEARLRYQRLRYDRPPQETFAEPGGRTTVFAEEGEPTGLIQEIGVQAETETETEVEPGEFEGEGAGETTRVDVEQDSGEQRTILQQEQEVESEQEQAIDTRRTGTGTDRFRGPAELPDQAQAGETARDAIGSIGEVAAPTQAQLSQELTQPTLTPDLGELNFESELSAQAVEPDIFATQTEISQPTLDFGQELETEAVTTPELEFESGLETEIERRAETDFEFEARSERRPPRLPPLDIGSDGSGDDDRIFTGFGEGYEIGFLNPLTGDRD